MHQFFFPNGPSRHPLKGGERRERKENVRNLSHLAVAAICQRYLGLAGKKRLRQRVWSGLLSKQNRGIGVCISSPGSDHISWAGSILQLEAQPIEAGNQGFQLVSETGRRGELLISCKHGISQNEKGGLSTKEGYSRDEGYNRRKKKNRMAFSLAICQSVENSSQPCAV